MTDFVTGWVKERSVTLGLTVFFITWYIIELVVLLTEGQDTAVWWFYFQHTSSGTPVISPGIFLAPISHKIDTYNHIIGNIFLLLIAGIVAEPYLRERIIVILVIGFSYVGIYTANILVPFHNFWNLAGASPGILSLWAYAGVRLGYAWIHEDNSQKIISRGFWSFVGVLLLVIGTILFLFHEAVLRVPPHSGHIAGILWGYIYYLYNR